MTQIYEGYHEIYEVLTTWACQNRRYFSVNVNKTEILQKNLINAYPVSKCNNAHAWSCIYILDEGSGSLYSEFHWISKKLGIYISFCKTCIKDLLQLWKTLCRKKGYYYFFLRIVDETMQRCFLFNCSNSSKNARYKFIFSNKICACGKSADFYLYSMFIRPLKWDGRLLLMEEYQ